MQFVVIEPSQAASALRPGFYLTRDNWNDWFKFQTLYGVLYVSDRGEKLNIGGIKIGQFGMVTGQWRPDIPDAFERLDNRFFSLGQDETYYLALDNLGQSLRESYLEATRDVAWDQDLFERARNEDVMGVSLLRYLSPATVQGQFRRLARGEARLERYAFSYTSPGVQWPDIAPLALSFNVMPESQPPTNVHVLIGRNGVGKTTLLHRMTRALADESSSPSETGSFTTEILDSPGQLFAGVVSVSFSAFDSFVPLPHRENRARGTAYAYVGLKKIPDPEKADSGTPKSESELAEDFANSVSACIAGSRIDRWRHALQILEADPIFADAEVSELADEELSGEMLQRGALALFSDLSSGHKIVLLMMTRLVETVEERTLVLLDEPEAHLHPPLLSAFVRALSDLLTNRNGVALIATHSPVVLQEVPQACVWKLRRSGRTVTAERPEIETFGENVGILTREIFGLEVSRSGFHRLIANAVQEGASYDDVVLQFGNRLGGEAKGMVRALFAARESGESI
ncbi:ATP-dependent endonuclease [Dactylosporangium siamense]|uniref:AAA+ ATPase domain-containing protein n=1 Tax=Dactylosporangium siamense TaxID=685454 RepID=A0A919Q092_9ACTN|nr:AAA family ATPase [Dactylosporangium siamense]GIG52907.1 hypothetical protein Dsi01nite_109480 [Dactylosporangium siamense]